MSYSTETDDPVVARLLEVPPLEIDAERAATRFRARVPASPPRWKPPFALPLRALRTGTAALAVVLVTSFLTVGGGAASFLQLFEPKSFVAVQVDPRTLGGLPDLSAYGNLTWSAKPSQQPVPDLGAAQAQAGFAPARPAALPAGVDSALRVTVIARTTGTFTLDGAAAAAAAARVGRTAPPMPKDLDGTALRGTAGPAVVQTYGGGTGEPTLIVAQGRAPLLESDGASLAELRAYLLAQPGLPPELAAQLAAISDPASTLPVPVPAQARSKAVRVQGVEGLLVGDSTGIGSVVIWRRGDFVYAVGGTLAEAQTLEVANSLR